MIKKEAVKMEKIRKKMQLVLGGIRDMRRIPSAIFIVDIVREHIALAEAKKLNIPIIAIVDSNANPEGIDYPIPSNDDAVEAIRLISSVITAGFNEGRKNYDTNAKAKKKLGKK